MSDYETMLARQCAWSRATFGPMSREKGVLDHMRKEMDEVLNATYSHEKVAEWADLVILAHDGLMRAVREQMRNAIEPIPDEPTHDKIAASAAAVVKAKLAKNELRDFGDWRGKSPDHAIEHVRGIHD